MLKYVRIILVVLFCLALAGAGALYYYRYTHEDSDPPSFRSDTDLLEVSVTDPSEALLQDLYAYDKVDGDLTDKIRVRDISSLINETDVKASYIVFDEASNYAIYNRTIRYRDYRSPRFDLIRPMIFSTGETVNFSGSITVTDQLDGNISGQLKLEESNVLNSVPGSYSARVSATNRMGDTIYLPLTVQIIDNATSRPTIKLEKYLMYVEQGSGSINFRRNIVEVKDPLDPDKRILKSAVSVNSSNLDLNTPGFYEVYYYYTGSSGDIATVILTVIVE